MSLVTSASCTVQRQPYRQTCSRTSANCDVVALSMLCTMLTGGRYGRQQQQAPSTASRAATSRTQRGSPRTLAASGRPACLGTPRGTRATPGTPGATPTPTSGTLCTPGTPGCGSPPATPPRRATTAVAQRPTPTAQPARRTMRPRPRRPTYVRLAATAGAPARAGPAPMARSHALSLHGVETLGRRRTAPVTLGAAALLLRPATPWKLSF